jgi:nucleoside 2-deoxyribosyltransferase
MRVYLASSFDMVQTVEAVAEYLELLGHSITVKWWSRDGFDLRDKKADQTSDGFYKDPVCEMIFWRDYQGVTDSDAFVIVAGDIPKKFNGANVEYGIAVALKKPCFSIGCLENSAMYYPVVKCNTLLELADKLEKVGGEKR